MPDIAYPKVARHRIKAEVVGALHRADPVALLLGRHWFGVADAAPEATHGGAY